jgi:hypothetical protein
LLAVATVAISVTISEDAFARERYSGDSTSQAAAVSNDCLNPIFDSNTIDNLVGVGNCGGTVSQQDESGQASAPITSQTANPTIELQRATTTTPPPGLGASMTCEECFDILSATQETAVEQLLAGDNNPLSPIWGPNPPTTIEELCQIWATFNSQQRGSADSDILELLDGVAVATQVEVVRCLNASPFTPAG